MTETPGRRWRSPARTTLLFLLYAAVAIATLGANPFRHQTITPMDVLVSQRAWAFVDPHVKVRDYQRSDTLNWLLPQWTEARRQLRDGHWPLWDDKIAGGGSFLTLSSTIFTPAFVIFSITPEPATGFLAAIAFNLAFAGLGMHLLLRRRVGWLATIVGAITFELCGFNAAWLYWPHVFTIIWAPWLLLAVERCAEKPGMPRALGISVASALVLLGGFPFVTLLVFAMAALYALTLFAFRVPGCAPRWNFAAWYVSGTLLGILLCAIPLAGLVSWLHQYDIGYRYGRGSYLNFHHVKQLFPPWAWQVQRVEQTMYVGAAMIAFSLAALVGLIARWRRMTPFALFTLILLPVSVGLVFGLWPMWLIGWVPGMAYNSWSRAIGIMDIALIILGALCIDHLWRLGDAGRMKWLRIALAAIALAQVAEMSMFFRSYNGPVSARYYYPPTPSIDYMREHAGPFDYVITDKSFLMSGTLGAYGLREWLAHYFRSPALQSALHRMAGHPFNSHRASASRFPASDIKYDSSAMAAYNVRYVAIDSRYDPNRSISVAPQAKGKHVALPAMPEHRYVQGFTLKAKTRLVGISVRLATYRQTNLPGQVTLQLRDATGQMLAEVTVGAASIADSTFVGFDFSKPATLDADDYTFSLNYTATETPAPRLTAWSFSTPRESTLQVDGKPTKAIIDYQLHTEAPGNSHFRRVFTGKGTTVLENDASPDGPYFLSHIAQQPNAQSGRSVMIETYRPARFELNYSGQSAGYIVVPMSFTDDWQVTVNGTPQVPTLKDGVLPAVKVSGPATIDFSYAPRVLRWLYPWLAALIATIALMVVTEKRMKFRTKSRSDVAS